MHRFLLLGIVLINIAYAQPEFNESSNVRVFLPNYFSEFDPVLAIDLVQRTPGFDPQEQSGGRGLSGVRSNLLINGERPPPKGQSAWQQLNNLPYTSVTRIELIDAGASLDIDMQGYSQVVNVILQEDLSNYYELISEYTKSGTGDIEQRNDSDRELNAKASFQLWNHEFSLRGGGRNRDNQSPANFVDIDPANPEQRVASLNRSNREEHYFEFSSLFNLQGESSLTVNAEFAEEDRASSPLALINTANAVNQHSTNRDEWQEFSAEYRRPIGSGGELMFAAVDSRSLADSDSSLAVNNLLRSSLRSSESGETAARLLLTQRPTDKLTVRATASTAFNYFEGSFQVLENGTPLPLSGSDSLVEEDRHSLELDADWNFNEQWIFRGGINVGSYIIDTRELSSGQQSESKGFASISYQPKDRTTITLESTQEIGQLSFSQFLASSNLSSQILQAGAGSLEAVRQWTHSLSYDRRFGDEGVFQLSIEHTNIENPVESVALSDTLVVSQNTSAAKITQLAASIEYPLENIGLNDYLVSIGSRIEDSNVIDPITGEKRKVSWSSPYQWSLGLRKDPGVGKWAWGLNTWKFAQNDNFSVRQIRAQSPNQEWRAFVEWEFIDGFKLLGRIEGRATRRQTSTFFAAVRQPGLDPSFISTSTTRRGKQATIALEWRRHENIEITASYRTRPGIETLEELNAFGSTTGTLLAREIARTPRVQLEFRIFR